MKLFDSDQAAPRPDSLSVREKSDLINDYVRQEVLYRRAIALGFDTDDDIIRRRLVQKVEFSAEALKRMRLLMSMNRLCESVIWAMQTAISSQSMRLPRLSFLKTARRKRLLQCCWNSMRRL